MERNSNYIQILTPFFLLSVLAPACSSTIATDQSALLSLKSKITSDPYNIVMQNWTIASPVCNWIGVTCGNRHHRVTYLNISYMSLAGVISPELGNLSFLISLDVRSNYFSGLIPEELSRLRKLRYISIGNNSFVGEVPSCFAFLPRLEFLYLNNNSFTSLDSFLNSFSNKSKIDTLDVSFNSLEGKIPESIGNLRTLKQLNMKVNKLSGFLPSSLGNLTSLVSLRMQNNRIEGSLPQGISNLHNLIFLDLQRNRLVGLIPSSIFNISTLQILALTDNSLSGPLPDDMCLRLTSLSGLYLSTNKLYGEIPSNISLCTQLQLISMSENNFTVASDNAVHAGEIPHALGELTELEILNFDFNHLSGSLPKNIYNMTSLRLISLVENRLSGNLPWNLGYFLPNLEELYLGVNNFIGVFPNYILNSSELSYLDLSQNKLTGPISSSLGNLRHLEFLDLESNGFTSGLGFIDSLTNCRNLTVLLLSHNNPPNSVLPASIGNLSSSLAKFHADEYGIEGNIPNEIGNLSGLISLSLGSNDLTGEIPRTLHNLANLQIFSLEDNRIRGLIPGKLCGLMSLGRIYLDTNQLTGPIPECLGNISSLREVYLHSNNLTSGIPSSIWNLKDLLKFNVSSNSLSGPLSPQLSNLKAAIFLDLSMNQFSGDIPNTFGELKQLVSLSLASNNFQGPIDESLGSMVGLVSLDLSHNKFNGTIPKTLEALRYLEFFNVSYNELSGEIPTNGPFQKFSSQSFMFNNALCGPSRFNVSSCPESQHMSKRKKKALLQPSFIFIGIGALIFIICLTCAVISYRRKKTPPTSSDTPSATGQPTRFSYYDLLHATENYSEDYLLGKGSFGSVYKCVLRDGTALAVKVFNIQLEGSFKSFEVECEALRNLHHRNLVKVLGSCTNQDFKALVLEYMHNGSLEKCLYSGNRFTDVMQRLDIMIDVASALEYLHHSYSTPVVHCDLKPGNVLLDENMVAHVSDFGLTKYLNEGQSITHTRTLATLGYMAPEYGSEGIVSTRCDVYSYGIMLLETFTRKRPSDEMFTGDITLRDWVKGSMPNAIIQVVDANLISPSEDDFNRKFDCILSILKLGLSCSIYSPVERKNMKQVAAEIVKIKNAFL